MKKESKTQTHLLISLKGTKQLLSRLLCPAAAMWLLTAPLVCSVLCPLAGLAEEETILKPDVPKLDTAPTVLKNTVLQGNVAHHAKIAPPPKSKPKRLNSRISKPEFGSLNGVLKGTTDNEKALNLNSGLQQAYTLDRSIGIIGIKFLKVGERPPLVNRVFPGTPAYKMGLAVDDVIVAVDGIPTYGLTKDACYDMIVGTPNTPVSVTLMHNGNFEVKNMLRMDFNEIPDPMVRRDYLHSL